MPGLSIFLAGLIILSYIEDIPKWVKTVIWIALVVIGIVGGALGYLHVS